MRARRTTASTDALLDSRAPAWAEAAATAVALVPAPVTMAAAVSPQLALSQSHGAVKSLATAALHDGRTLSVRLAWADPTRDDAIRDLDRFADAAAIMFPLREGAISVTMGDAERPVNVWLWRSDQAEPYDVIAHGYSTSQRRAANASGLAARGHHEEGGWAVVLQRALRPRSAEFAAFEPGTTGKIAFAVWDGSNAERAGQKAVSGAFVDLPLDP